MLVALTLMHQLKILRLVRNDFAHFLVGKHGSSSLIFLSDESLILLRHIVSVLFGHSVRLQGLVLAQLLLQLRSQLVHFVIFTLIAVVELLELCTRLLRVIHDHEHVRQSLLQSLLFRLKPSYLVLHMDLLGL